MKTIFVTALLAFGLSMNAQVNKNVTEETTTTKVTVDNGEEKKQIVKTDRTQSTQDIELKDAESKKLNKDVKETPVKVTKSSTISGDGIATQKLGETTYYSMNGRNYMFVSDKAGYKISTPENLDYGVLRKTSNNNYIYKTDERTSFGYFDGNGNFVVETYNNDTDGVTVETYKLIKK